jgi:spermidine synthase
LTNNFSKEYSETQVNRLGFLFWVKWVFSFLWPIRIDSAGEGDNYLEVVLFKGKRLLNSKNANYSNGNLQEAFKRFFNEVDVRLQQRTNALVLGFGFGGVCRLIYNYNPEIRQTGVENNEQIVAWYHLYCNPIPRVHIEIMDAGQLVKDDIPYDIIIVDLYEDLEVPSVFQTGSYLAKLSSLLSADGVLVFNKVVKTKQHEKDANQLLIDLSGLFKSVKTNNQFDLNRFFVATNKT